MLKTWLWACVGPRAGRQVPSEQQGADSFPSGNRLRAAEGPELKVVSVQRGWSWGQRQHRSSKASA